MATNQTIQIRQIFQPQASINALTQTQVLELIQDETLGGATADVNLLQVGDIITISPSDVAQPTIAAAAGNIVPPAGQRVCRVFVVVGLAGLATTPASRHVLIELNTTDSPLFW
jgi:hypothetical protein